MLDDATLWARFLAATLPRSEWTHVAHLRVAWMFVRHRSLDEAHVLMRIGIVKLNASHELVETTARGYHETLTRVWLVLVGAAAARTPDIAESSQFVATHADSLGRDAPLRHYSRQRLLSVAARACFIGPDLAPLPC